MGFAMKRVLWLSFPLLFLFASFASTAIADDEQTNITMKT